MEFMKIYEVDNKNYLQYDNKIIKVYVQEDVWDFHVFRLIKESENEFLVEMDNINKEKVADFMKIEEYNDVRGLFKKFPSSIVGHAIVEVDIDNGFEIYESKNYPSLEDAISEIKGE